MGDQPAQLLLFDASSLRQLLDQCADVQMRSRLLGDEARQLSAHLHDLNKTSAWLIVAFSSLKIEIAP